MVLSKKQMTLSLMKKFVDYRLKRLSTARWLEESAELVECLAQESEADVASRLFLAQLLITRERSHEAGWLLDHVVDMMKEQGVGDNALWAYYLYLTTLLNPDADYIEQIKEQVEKIYRREPDNWRVAWLLLYLTAPDVKTPAFVYGLVEEQYKAGNFSPILSLEAVLALNQNPALLRRLDACGLAMVAYGAREALIGPELLEQILYLAGKGKEFSFLLLCALERLAKTYDDTRLVQEIAALRIKGNFIGAASYPWYEKAILAQARITNLYEYYMLSLDLETDVEIPKAVLLYFSFQNNLDYQRSAYLYAFLILNRTRFEEQYDLYTPRMALFTLNQIQKGHFNKDLAVLYRHFLEPSMIDEANAPFLAKCIFAHRIQVLDTRMCKVIITQPDNEVPLSYPLTEGKAIVPIYGEACTLEIEDAEGTRHGREMLADCKVLMRPDRYVKIVAEKIQGDVPLFLYLETNRGAESLSDEALRRSLYLVKQPTVSAAMRRILSLRIIDFYDEAANATALSAFLDGLDTDLLDMADKEKIFAHLVALEKWDSILAYLEKDGAAAFDPVEIALAFDGLLAYAAENALEAEEILHDAAWHCFTQEITGAAILSYLGAHHKGSMEEYMAIYRACEKEDLERFALAENILLRMITRSEWHKDKMDVFAYYAQFDGSVTVKVNFLEYCSVQYFSKDAQAEPALFEQMEQLSRAGENLPNACLLAYLKYCHAGTALKTPKCLRPFLATLLAKGICLPFFFDFVQENDLLTFMNDKTILEFHSVSGLRLKVLYSLPGRPGQDFGKTESVYLKEICPGIYTYPFVLFFGESLFYEIQEELPDGSIQSLKKDELPCARASLQKAESRYDYINRLSYAAALGDNERFEKLYDDYLFKEFLNRYLFEENKAGGYGLFA